MDFSQNDVHEILKIVDGAQHLDEIELDFEGLKLHIRRSAADSAHSDGVRTENARQLRSFSNLEESIESLQPASVQSNKSIHEPQAPKGMSTIRAPMLGSFYRSPAPGEAPFVEVGQQVKADDTVCLIEVMKLFNSVKAGVDGIVLDILVADAALVEYNQALIVIKPKESAA